MSLSLEDKKDTADWDWQDEVEYSHIKLRYGNRKALQDEATKKLQQQLTEMQKQLDLLKNQNNK